MSGILRKYWPKGVSTTLTYRHGEKPLHAYVKKYALEKPNSVAYIFYGKEFTWKEIDESIDKFSGFLHGKGVEKGDAIALFLQNCPQYIISHYAIQRLGCTVVPMNPMYKESELEKIKPSKILVVTDQILVKLGVIDKFLYPLKEEYEVSVYTDVEPEPSLLCAQTLLDTRNGCFDCVIGMGGGSTLDLAKMTAVLSQNEGDVQDYLNLSNSGQLIYKGSPKILIPSTSGTGSEVTDIAVFSLEGTKDIITHEFLLPDISIVDPQLTLTVPRRITAATGIDALTQMNVEYIDQIYFGRDVEIRTHIKKLET